MLPSVPLPPPFPMKLSMPLFEEEGSKVIPTFPLLVFFFSSPVTEEACYQSKQT